MIQLDAARKRSYNKEVNFLLFDGRDTNLADHAYDLAVLSHVLEHAEAPRLLLQEAARIANYVYVEVPLELNIRTPRRFHWTDTGHINFYNLLLIRYLLETCGLRILAEKVTCPDVDVFTFLRPGLTGYLHHAIKKTLLKIAPGLVRNLFTYNACLMAKSEEERVEIRD